MRGFLHMLNGGRACAEENLTPAPGDRDHLCFNHFGFKRGKMPVKRALNQGTGRKPRYRRDSALSGGVITGFYCTNFSQSITPHAEHPVYTAQRMLPPIENLHTFD